MLRTNHYDRAFEAFLRARRTPYVAVDEQRRALLEQASLKSMDFIVYSPRARNWLVDVKGRQFPSGAGGKGSGWQNWATAEDLPSLLKWQEVFGGGFRAVLVFAYHLVSPRALRCCGQAFEYQHRRYAFYGVWADDYAQAMRRRSLSWDTVSLSGPQFRELRFSVAECL